MTRNDIDLKEDYTPRNILAIDLKCFYASVECIERGLDPFKTPLVVCDTSRGQGTIILAVSPFLKEKGVPSRCRRYELPKDIPNIIYATPRMSLYIKKSTEINKIYREFVSKDDIHIYSIDESFLDVTDYLKASKMNDVQFAKKIIKTIKEKTGLTVCAGIGENLFLAKVAMDIGAKHKKDLIDKWTLDDVPKKLWPISPLSKVWSIGTQMEKKLNNLGLFTMGDIANYDPFIISQKFGIKGEELFLHANGIDRAIISKKINKKPKTLTVGQVLFFDANKDEAIRIAKEMSRTLAKRLKESHSMLNRLCLAYVGSKENPLVFSKYLDSDHPLDTSKELEDLVELISSYCPSDFKIRNIYLVGENLNDDCIIQESLFSNKEKHEKEKELDEAIDKVRKKYGSTSIMRASSLTKHSTEKQRLTQIGGHKA